jgi:hypothetical protein
MVPKCDFCSADNNSDGERFEFAFGSDTILYWSPLLHMQMTQFYRKMQHIQGVLSPDTGNSYIV